MRVDNARPRGLVARRQKQRAAKIEKHLIDQVSENLRFALFLLQAVRPAVPRLVAANHFAIRQFKTKILRVCGGFFSFCGASPFKQ